MFKGTIRSLLSKSETGSRTKRVLQNKHPEVKASGGTYEALTKRTAMLNRLTVSSEMSR